MSDYDPIEQVIIYLNTHFREQPDLATIAAQVGMSEYHLQRTFRRWAGISPKRFVQYLTAEYVRDRLAESRDVLGTAFEAGLSGPGRLHDLTVNVYAMTPAELRDHGAGLTITYGFHDSPFGECLIGTTPRGVCALRFVPAGEHERVLADLRAEWPAVRFERDFAATQPVVEQVFSADRRALPLLVKGTNFQIRVWEALLRIPSGALVSYGDVALAIGSPRASRAVGSAAGCNPIAYLIPCHRVIRRTGVIGEYRWESPRKQAILAWEAAQLHAGE